MNDNSCDNEKSSGCCGGPVERRDFLRLIAFGTAVGVGMPVMAGPFEPADFEKMIPADKKLDPAWVKSLFARGERTTYRGAELEKIGMPIGGLCAGQLYLGGDGKLWHWDIFNQKIHTGDKNYAHPPQPNSPLEQGFGIRIKAGSKSEYRPLNRQGFSDVAFRGEYPIGLVEYSDPKSAVKISLEAFSPFVPLDVDASSHPATVLQYTIQNTSDEKIEADVIGWLQNAVSLFTVKAGPAQRENRIVRSPELLLLDGRIAPPAPVEKEKPRPDIVFESFDKETYEGWTVTGEAFGKGPILRSQIPAYQGDVGSKSVRVVNSHASAPGDVVADRDKATGSLTSKPFKIERNFIAFWIGGGNHPNKTCVNLLIDDKTVRMATGHNDNRMRREAFDVREFNGQTAKLQIVDNVSGAWGNIGVAEITFTDTAPVSSNLENQHDFGTLTLGLVAPQADDIGVASIPFDKLSDAALAAQELAKEPADKKLVGGLVRRLSLAPGGSATVSFVLAWHFPNLALKDGGRFYATRFSSASDVAKHVAKEFDSLLKATRLWRDTWYDSTLPYWFLDRTFANTSILATSTSHRFRTGRFYGWEGVGCCPGTCTHVWHYAQAVGRLFPELERNLRERTDFGDGLDLKSGTINHRGDGAGLAVDGQAGCILRAYREHQMSKDATFLKKLWPKIKLAMQCLVRMDTGAGLIEGAQHNTLDQPWFGKVAWLSSLYVAAARACEEMAREMDDEAYAKQMREIIDRGGKNIDEQLFNGEYYVHIPDKDHVKTVGSHNGCEIDQIFGQSWAFQVGLGRLFNEKNVKQALASLWKYNFTPDVGPFRARYKPGRWYAMAGEGGLIMCTWPKGDAARVQTGFDFYFNECMNGFEYQVAGHMIWEGMVQEGLAITRAIHDRYHASRRNPWNEVECGDHYARSMASYGVYLAVCGYEYHGPKGYLAFAPRVSPEKFRAAFTAAEGWGTFSQERDNATQREQIELKRGSLRLGSLGFELRDAAAPKKVTVKVNGQEVESKQQLDGKRLKIVLAQEATLQAGQKLEVVIE